MDCKMEGALKIYMIKLHMIEDHEKDVKQLIQIVYLGDNNRYIRFKIKKIKNLLIELNDSFPSKIYKIDLYICWISI